MSDGAPLSPDELVAPLLEAGWEWVVHPTTTDDNGFVDEQFVDGPHGGATAEPGRRPPAPLDPTEWDGVLGRGITQVAVGLYEDLLAFGPRHMPADSEAANLLDSGRCVDVEADDVTMAGVRELAAATGMLDVADIAVDGRGVTTEQVLAEMVMTSILEPASEARGISGAQLVDELRKTGFDELFNMLPLTARRPMPEAVPPAAALAIAAYGWRNTDIENAHSAPGSALTDPVMAKLNIAATRIAQRHCTNTRVEWVSIEAEWLTRDRALPDGRMVGDLLGSHWATATQSMRDCLSRLRDIEKVIGAAPMVKYLSMLGSMPGTSRWWGTGRWSGLCSSVLDDRAAAAVPLPAPYDRSGTDALYEDLVAAPDELPDEVLWFCINPLEFDGRWFHGLRDAVLQPPATVQLEATGP